MKMMKAKKVEQANEQVRLLNNLASEESTLYQVHQELIMKTAPDWKRLETTQIIDENEAQMLGKIHGYTFEMLDNMLKKNPGLLIAMMKVLYFHSAPHPSQYVLTLMYELVRDNSARYDFVYKTLEHFNVLDAFNQILMNSSADSYSADRAAFLLSSFMCRNRFDKFSDEDIKNFISITSSKQTKLSEIGKLDAFNNLSKYDKYRSFIWENPQSVQIIKSSLNPYSSSANLQYRAMFCIWLASFQPTLLNIINEHGMDVDMCIIIKENRKEKIVRVFIKALKNFMLNDDIAEVFINYDVFRILTILEYEKWRDLELYDDIRDGKFQLDKKIKSFSNFGRYCSELDKKTLKWSVLHSEKFWKENVMSFEQDEFSAIRKLSDLLQSADAETQSIACYDLGEFARFHPAGKKICQMLHIKERVMLFIDHETREVAREALLCLQKLMLNNWQDVSGTPSKSH